MESTIEAIHLEVADYLEKPVSLRTVESAIQQGLKKRSMKQKQIQKQLMTRRDQCNKENLKPKETNTINDFGESIPGMVRRINNLLVVINAAVSLAERSLDNKEKLERHLSAVLKASQKIAVINQSIMNFGKTLGEKTND